MNPPKMPPICPRCEQDEVIRATVLHNGIAVRVCPECDAMWPAHQEVDLTTFIQLGTYLQSLGRPPLWSELELIEAQDEKVPSDEPPDGK